jgi:uncharacterized protein YndB with AHSA1/START domain
MATGAGATTRTKTRPSKKRPSAVIEAKHSNFATKVSDDAVQKATGKTWPQWFKLLDKAGCAKMNHKEIVAVVAKHFDGPWWGQMVAVGYEQARGLRELNQSCDGVFQASSSKTVSVPVARLFDAWHDAKQRGKWLGDTDGELVIRKATKPKSLRVTWCDGSTHVDVNLFPKGDAKSYVSLQHTKLKDGREVEKMKRYWAGALEKMKASLEA